MWSFHHLLLDGWSMPLVFRELFQLYNALSEGRDVQLPPVRPYRDYIRWLRRQDMSRAESFWRKTLAGFSEPTPLVVDKGLAHEDPAPEEAGHGEEQCELPEAATANLRALARQSQLTLNSIVQGAWALLLSRYSGREDVLFGVTVSGRPDSLPGAEAMVGMFINTIPLRVRVRPELRVREWLKEVHERQAELRQYEYTPLVEARGWSDVRGAQPLFESLFLFQNYPVNEVMRQSGESLKVSDFETFEKTNFPLTVAAAPGDRLWLSLEYDARRFDRATIRRMLGHFARLLEGFAADPDRRLSELALLSDEEQHRLLVEWNATSADYPRQSCIHELFERRAERAPDALAVVTGGDGMSYGELNARANQLAHHLRALGVGPEVRVGVMLERSAELVVALLAVLKAGGAYVPLDPEYPAGRLSFMLEDSGAAVLVTEPGLLGRVPGPVASVVCLDAERERIAGESTAEVGCGVGPENLAYVIYTSGSTGTPKGAMISHRSLVAFAQGMREQLRLRPDDRFLQFASFSFDVFAEEVFPTWLSGAAVVLAEKSLLASVKDLTEVLRANRVTGCELPTAYWHEWVRELTETGERLPESLRFVLVGGEIALQERVRSWRRFGVELIHVYGLTEVTVTSTTYTLPPVGGEPESASEFPIGRPTANTRAYILDAHLRPVPVGVPGELYFGGEGVARGYLNRPELTAAKFVPDPFSAEPGARLYRTGDSARYLPDGNIKFIGRIDSQVKVRGYRIELEEIEVVLGRHAQVNEAVVVAREDPGGEKRLVAYVVPREGGEVSAVDAGRAGAEAGGDGTPELWPSHGEYPIYDETLYHAMTSDEWRNEQYKKALGRLAEGKTVVDVGCGGDAALTRLCVEAGAAKVYAIERQDDSYRRARALIEREGLADRVSVIHGDAARVELGEAVDLCVSELIGTIGGSEGAATILNGARRFLKPGGEMIPRRCVTMFAAVSLPDETAARPRFTEVGRHYAEKVFAAVGRRFDLRVCVKNLAASHLLSGAGVFEDLDFTRPTETEQSRRVRLRVERDGRLDGFLFWINLYVLGGEKVDSLRDRCSWLPLYLPVFDGGAAVSAGDVIEAECVSGLSGNGVNPDYRVRGRLTRRGGAAVEFDRVSSHHEGGYRQSGFYCALFDNWDATPEQAEEARGAAGAALTRAGLRAYLGERLPEYMIPSAFVTLPALPLTPNGKVDRRALPAPGDAGVLPETDFGEPRTQTEEMLAGIFADLLGVARVGVRDNFFESGGHSLLAMQLVSRVRETFRAELPLRAVFAAPTVAGLSEAVEAASRAGLGPQSLPLRPAPRGGDLPLSFAQQRLWFFDKMNPGSPLFNMPVAVRLTGRLDVAALERTFNEIVRRHEVLRTSFAAVNGRPVQVVAQAARLALEVEDLCGQPEAAREREARRRADEELRRPFDLGRGPLMRVRLLRLGAEHHVVLFTMHHIVSDGWSLGVLVKEVAALYDAFARGETRSPLTELPVQYADYAVWQREWLRGDALEAQLDYWRGQLAGAPTLALPTDRPRPPAQSHRGAEVAFTFPNELLGSLRALCRREGVTLFMLLLAAFQTLLHRYARQDDIVVGADMANRNRRETEDLIGFFINMLVMRTDLSGDPSFLTLLKRVREVALAAYAHQDLPFDKLVEELGVERDLSRNPLFQVVLVFENTPTLSLELPGLTLSPVRTESKRVTFDLVLTVGESPEGLAGSMDYSTDLFDPSTVERMITHLRNILESVAQDPEQKLSDLRLLTEQETAGFSPDKLGKLRLSQKAFENLVLEISENART